MSIPRFQPSAPNPQDSADTAVVEVTAKPEELSLTQKAGDAANRWMARNRSLVLRQTPIWAQSLAGLMIGLGGIFLIGGIFFRIDEVVTVQGQLKSIGGTVDVKTPAGGRVAEVLFKDGEVVEKGQKLLRFDTRQAANQKNTLTRLIALEEDQLQTQLKTVDSQKNSLVGRQHVLEKRLKTKSIILSEMQVLVEQGGFQRLQFLEQQDQFFELQKQLGEIQEEQNRIQLQEDQIRLQSRKSINQMRNQLQEAELQLQYQNVLAPVAGVVFDPKARPEGVLRSGERILSIVPQQGLYAEVFVPNKDIGFVKTGQSAKIRVDAFPFTRYGELPAAVSQIAADALEPDAKQNFYRFPVKLKLERSTLESSGVSIPLKPGMAVTSNLKLRDKRVISLLSDLLVDQTDSVRSIRQQ
tara:strand:- start:4257 stop:5489 length:1233 start_codon:yes stop_codon:yes gene_type:complete